MDPNPANRARWAAYNYALDHGGMNLGDLWDRWEKGDTESRGKRRQIAHDLAAAELDALIESAPWMKRLRALREAQAVA
jgi:hypothetical protein